MVRDYIRAGFRQVRERDGKLGAQFWTVFYQTFPSLAFGCVAFLPDPPQICLPIRDSLQQSVSLALNPNVALRSVDQFVNVLKGIDDQVNESEILGIIQASEEGPYLARSGSVKMKVAILELFERSCVS